MGSAPLNLSRGGLAPYELAQAYRQEHPGVFDALDDYELVRAIKDEDPDTYALMDPLLEGAELLLAKKATPPPARPESLIPPPPQLRTRDIVATTGLRVVPSILGAGAGFAFGGPMGMMGGGAAGAGIGETAAQWYEKSFGPREQFDPRTIAFESMLGTLNPAARATTRLGRMGLSAAYGAGMAGVGGPGRTLIEEGRLRMPTAVELAAGAAFGGATQGGAEAVSAAGRAAGMGDVTGALPTEAGPPPSAADQLAMAQASAAQYQAEEARLAAELRAVFGPDATRPSRATDYHTALRAKSYLEELAALQQTPVAIPPYQPVAGPAPAVPQLPPGRGDPNAIRAFPPDENPPIELVGPMAPPASRVVGGRDVGAVEPAPTFESALEASLQAPPGPPRLVRPIELTPPPAEPSVPRETSQLFPPPRPSMAGPIEQGARMGGRPPTAEQPRIPGVETPGYERPYATGPNAGPRRKREAHGQPRTIRRQVQTGKTVRYEEAPTALTAEDPGTYPPEVRRELATMAWELEQFPHERVPGGLSTAAAQDLVRSGEAHDISEAIGILRKRGATAGGAIAGAPVYHEVIEAAKGAHAHIKRSEMLQMVRAALLEGKGNALTDAAAQVARRRLSERTAGLGRKSTILAQRGNEGDDLIRWVDEAGTEALPAQSLDEWQRAARDADDSEINAAIRMLDEVGEEGLNPDSLPFFHAARDEAVRRGLIRMEQPSLKLLGPGAEGGPGIREGRWTAKDISDAMAGTSRQEPLVEGIAPPPPREGGRPQTAPTKRVAELEALATDEAMGVTFTEEGESLLPRGRSAVNCTNCADRVIELVGRGEVYGWGDGENPTSVVSGPVRGARTDRGQGHDFAVIDDRYLVDPWAKNVEGSSARAAFDLQDPADLQEVRRLYGDPATWQRRTAQGWVAETPGPLRTVSPPPETPLSELTARRKARALASAEAQEVAAPPPPTTPEQAARNAAARRQRELELAGGGAETPAELRTPERRLPHEFMPAEPEGAPALPGLEGVRLEERAQPPVTAPPPQRRPPPPEGPPPRPEVQPSLFEAERRPLLRRLLEDEQGVLILDIPPGDRTGLRRWLKQQEKDHGGEAWFSRVEEAIEEGNWDRAWQAAASASMRSYTKAVAAARTPQDRAILDAAVRGTPLQEDLAAQIVTQARRAAGVGEQPKALGYPPTKRVTQAGAARGRARVGPAGILSPGPRQRPLSAYDKEGKLAGGAAPELRAGTLDREVVRLIMEDITSPEGISTIPGNQDTYLRLFRQVGEQVYKGQNLQLLREAGVRIPPEELAQHWNATISDAGRTLQLLSRFAQAHADVLGEAAARMDMGAALAGSLRGGPPRYVGARSRELSPAGQRAAQEVVDQIAERSSRYQATSLANDMQKRTTVGPLRALHDASYAWMLSKWNTAVRNYISFAGRYSMDSLDHALTIPIAQLTGEEQVGRLSRELLRERGAQPVGRPGTAVTPKAAWADDLQGIYSFTTDQLNNLKPEDARRAIRLLLDVPEQAAHFLGRATGEDLQVMADYSGVPVMRHLLNPKVQRFLTMFNRAQEFSARATVFDATTRALLRAKGLDPNDVLMRPTAEIIDAVGGRQAFDTLLQTATAQSLEATFAGRTSRDSLPGALIRFINEAWPIKLGVPFPRFNLSAAPRWIYDHSPAALLDWVRFPLDRLGITAPKGTLAGGRLYRGVRSQEIQHVELPALQERVSVAERQQGEALQDLLATQREWQVRQRQIRRLERRVQPSIPGTEDALTEARRLQDQLGRRREQLKSTVREQQTVVRDLQSEQKKLLERVNDATGINAPTFAQSLARMSVGTVGLLGAAWVVRSQEGAEGTRWYEYRVDREGKDPIILDFRPFAPFAQYLFVADVLNDFYRYTDWEAVRKEVSNLPEGTPDTIEHALSAVGEPLDWTSAMWNHYQGKYTEGELGSQFAQAFLSISRAAGTTLTLTDLMTQNGWPSLEDASRAIVGTIGQFFSRFTVPGQQISDIAIAPFSEEEAKVRTPPRATVEDWERPLAAPLANVPLARQVIPERLSQTTGQPVATEYPLLRGLLGIGTAPRDFIVEEVRRVGVPGQSVYIRETGDYGLDRAVAEAYSSVLKELMPGVLESDTYRELGTPALQRDYLQRSIFPTLKRIALADARQVVGEERYTEATVRGEEARRRARQQELLDSLEADLPAVEGETEEPEIEPPPGPPAGPPAQLQPSF